jgi:cobalt transporter subunit CbtB
LRRIGHTEGVDAVRPPQQLKNIFIERSNGQMTEGQHHSAAVAQTPAAALTQQRAVAIAGAIFGLFLIFGIGFAHPEAIHNAAHDARHSFAFPCH